MLLDNKMEGSMSKLHFKSRKDLAKFMILVVLMLWLFIAPLIFTLSELAGFHFPNWLREPWKWSFFISMMFILVRTSIFSRPQNTVRQPPHCPSCSCGAPKEEKQND